MNQDKKWLKFNLRSLTNTYKRDKKHLEDSFRKKKKILLEAIKKLK